MNRDPKTQNHPKSVYLITIFVLCIVLFVLAGVINQLGFSSHGPGLLIPLVKKFEKKKSPILEASERRQRQEEHQRFHHTIEVPHAPEAFQPTCFTCHSNLPHSKNEKIRSLLNMHTHYLTCEMCHLKITKQEKVVYKWWSPVEKNPKGPFFGTSYNPVTGNLEMVDNHFSKIAPFYEIAGGEKSTVHIQDKARARDFMRVSNRLTPKERKDRTQKFHLDIKPKGPSCETCHSTTGILNFKKLGFSEKRAVDLENLNIAGLITKYKVFYLPELLGAPAKTGPNNQDGK